MKDALYLNGSHPVLPRLRELQTFPFDGNGSKGAGAIKNQSVCQHHNILADEREGV